MPPQRHICRPPCSCSFETARALKLHYNNQTECGERWLEYFNTETSKRAVATTRHVSNFNLSYSFRTTSPQGVVNDPPQNFDTSASASFNIREQPERDLSGIGHMDADDTSDDNTVDEDIVDIFPRAGEIKRSVDPPFSSLRGHFEQQGRGNLYHPFTNIADWELAVWLEQSGLPVSEIDKYLKLKSVSAHPPSFKTADGLRDVIEGLPNGGPRWKSVQVPVEGEVSDAQSVTLFFRDPLEAIQSLLKRPSLADCLQFAPQRIWEDSSKKTRRYSEMCTGNWWWRTQAALPLGATVVPVILGSDQTHLSTFGGDKKAWPIYLSIGNISAKARNKPSHKAWVLIGYIPVVKFAKKDISTALRDRLFHKCMGIILHSLKQPGRNGTDMVDSLGNVRFSFPLVAAYIADHPEHGVVNAAACKNSPTTTAGSQNLGNSYRSPPRTQEWILTNIGHAKSQCRDRPNDIAAYQKAAKALGLNAVDEPFWKDLPGYEPELAVSPDILHGPVRMWRDHILRWVTNLIGEDELDRRLKALQPVVGYRHFSAGVKHLSQWTGREDRELQRYLVAIVAGHPKMPPKALRSLSAFHHFLYLCQYSSHSDTTLDYLSNALADFHNTKQVWIVLGARRSKRGPLNHFNFPKMAALLEYEEHIKEMGTSPQFSTETVESCHQVYAKAPYRSTNHKDFVKQMCRSLDRKDRLLYHQEFLDWVVKWDREYRINQELAPFSPGYQALSRRYIEEDATNPAVVREANTGQIWLTNKPHYPRKTLEWVSNSFRVDLRFLREKITSFLSTRVSDPTDPTDISIVGLDVWERLSVRTVTVQDEDMDAKPRTVQALPPSRDFPYGRSDSVMVKEDPNADLFGIRGYRVAQVRLIFRPLLENTSHPLHGTPLALVEWFSRPRNSPEKNLDMYIISRPENRQLGIVEVENITRFIHLVPKFGKTVGPEVSHLNSGEVYKHYIVNSFADKEIYQSVW